MNDATCTTTTVGSDEKIADRSEFVDREGFLEGSDNRQSVVVPFKAPNGDEIFLPAAIALNDRLYNRVMAAA